jgi:hypothetical protein
LAAENSGAFFSVDLSDGTHLSFANFDELAGWIDTEQAAFQWLNEGGGQAGVGALREEYMSGLQNLRQHVQQWRNNPDQTNLAQNVLNVFQGTYSSPRVVRSDHQFARIASDVAKIDGALAASATLAFLLGVPCTINFETVKGIFVALLKRNGIDPNSSNIVVKTVDDLNRVASQDRIKQETQFNVFSTSAKSFLNRAENDFQAKLMNIDTIATETLNRTNESVDGSLRRMSDTEAVYKNQMALQAPAEYWTCKAKTHRDAIKWSRGRLVAFAVLGTGLLLYALFWFAASAAEIVEKTKADNVIYLKFAVIGAIVTTIFFWIGRVLLRIYFSDRHLLTDAEERVAMIMTYLALSNDQKVDASERSLVLAPIFRAAADGIVKEEGPEASLAGIVAKMLDVKATK